MWIQQKNLRLCLLPDNCRTTLSKATASLWAWEQTASSSFCASSSPALGSWVKWSWPRRSQFSAASVNCCDQPVAQTQLSSWPWKSQWCSRRLSLAIEFSCTASKSCKEKSWQSVHFLLRISMGREISLFRCSIRNCWCRIHRMH